MQGLKRRVKALELKLEIVAQLLDLDFSSSLPDSSDESAHQHTDFSSPSHSPSLSPSPATSPATSASNASSTSNHALTTIKQDSSIKQNHSTKHNSSIKHPLIGKQDFSTIKQASSSIKHASTSKQNSSTSKQASSSSIQASPGDNNKILPWTAIIKDSFPKGTLSYLGSKMRLRFAAEATVFTASN